MDKWKIRKIRKEVKQYDDGSALSFLELLDLLEYDILHFHEKGHYFYLLQVLTLLSEKVDTIAFDTALYERIQNIRVNIKKILLNKKMKEKNRATYSLLKKILGKIEILSLTCNDFIDHKYDGSKMELLYYLLFSIKNVDVLENLIQQKPHLINLLDKKAYQLFLKVLDKYLEALRQHVSNHLKYFDDVLYYDEVLQVLLKYEGSHLSIGDYRCVIQKLDNAIEMYMGENQERYLFFIHKWETYFLNKMHEILCTKSLVLSASSLDEICYEFMVPKEFSLPVLQASTVCYLKNKKNLHKRKLPKIYTVDGLKTKVIDDGFSCSYENGLYHLGIHIANPLLYMDSHSILLQEATKRIMTLYLPDTSIPLFPTLLSQDLFSLKAGEAHQVLSLYVDINLERQRIEHSYFQTEWVNVLKNDSYASCDQILASHTMNEYKETLVAIQRVLPFLRKYFQVDAVYSLVNESSDAILPTQTKSEQMVATLAIFMNRYAATFALNKNIPFLYRNHELKNFYREELEQFKMVLKKEKNTRAYLNEIEILKSRYPKSYYDIVNRGHAGLHITAYSHITSPIRRVADDYNMLSIMKWLANDTSDMEWYKHELLLKEIADYINHQQKALDTFSFRYFLQKKNKPH